MRDISQYAAPIDAHGDLRWAETESMANLIYKRIDVDFERQSRNGEH
jgi:hypothetical protein